VIAFTLRRLASALVVMFALSVVVFLIFFATPGIDPARQLAGKNPNPATLQAIRRAFGLDHPLPVQYALMMKHLLIDRDLRSYTNSGVKVIPEIAAATPVTLSLVLGAAVIWVLVSVALGSAAAVLRDTLWDRMLMLVALIGISMPVFWLGEVVNLFTQDRWHGFFLFSWIPPLGYTSLTQNPVMWLRHLVVPWCVLATLYVGLYARVLRAAMIETGGMDFVRTARAKGISERRVLVRHVLRTSLIGFVSVFGLDFAALVGGGALLVEVVFGLPGVGLLTYQSLQGLDLPVIMATVLYGGFFVILLSALVDVLYARLDPRISEA
jgi:peptide/nickel transport system permease protein